MGRNAWGFVFKVVEELPDALRLQSEETLQIIRCRADEVELVDMLEVPPPPPRLYLVEVEQMQLATAWPMCEGLKMKEKLTGDHIMMGDWLMRRDLGQPRAPASAC